MSITPISKNSNSYLMPSNSHNILKQLEKSKSQLQDQITKIGESKLDDKTKQERIKMLQDQIKQIDIEIQTKKTEKANENQKKEQNSANPTDEANNKYDGSLEVMTGLIEAKATYSKAEIMNRVKNHLHSDGKMLKKEIEEDESRSLSGSKAEIKRQQLEKIESSEKDLSKKVTETNRTVQNQVEQASSKTSGNKSDDVKDTEADKSVPNGSPKQDITAEGGSGEEKK